MSQQKNDADCGVFTRLFARHLLLSRGNHSGLTLNGEPRAEMVSDLEMWPYLAMKLSFIIIAWNEWLLRTPN